jgi:hypothetical protein
MIEAGLLLCDLRLSCRCFGRSAAAVPTVYSRCPADIPQPIIFLAAPQAVDDSLLSACVRDCLQQCTAALLQTD